MNQDEGDGRRGYFGRFKGMFGQAMSYVAPTG